MEKITSVAISNLLRRFPDRLDDRQKRILELRFGLWLGGYPKTLEEVGQKFNLTRERIRQIEIKSLEILQTEVV